MKAWLVLSLRTVGVVRRISFSTSSFLGKTGSTGRKREHSRTAIHIIGIGSDGLAGLTSRARDLLQSADLVFGAEQTLKLLPELQAERRPLGTDLQEAVGTLTGLLGRKRLAIVAGGDPLFYGVARYLCDRIGKEHFEVLPHVSSMQLAFARVKETWEEAYLTNLQTHPLETVLDRIRTAETVGLFPSENEGPPEIARHSWRAASIISASSSARTLADPTSVSLRASCATSWTWSSTRSTWSS